LLQYARVELNYYNGIFFGFLIEKGDSLILTPSKNSVIIEKYLLVKKITLEMTKIRGWYRHLGCNYIHGVEYGISSTHKMS